jgi:branched-chain amino acid transport system ATP-binding protein
MTVRENLDLGNYAGHAKRDLLSDVYDLFPALKKLSNAPAASLSGGQQQMLAVGRALMSDPSLLLMDEPSLGLAPRVVDDILGVASQLATRGVAVVLAEQNARKSLRVASSAIFLESGRVVLAGDPEILADDPAVLHAYFGTERQ